MCQTFGKHSEQIEKFVQNGMPQKIVKTVQYTMRKRAQEQQQLQQQEETAAQSRDIMTNCDDNTDNNKIITTITNNTNHDIMQVLPCETTAAATAIDASNLNENVKSAISTEQQIQSELKIPKLCGRFRAKTSSNIKDKTVDVSNNNNVNQDWLGTSTQLTKQIAQQLNFTFQKLQSGRLYTILTKTTQPAHLIAICLLSFVLLTVYPDLIEYSSTASQKENKSNMLAAMQKSGGNNNNNTLMTIAYLAAFATHFGSQIWMTFVSGLSLYFSLPRHTFGQCQQILFPKYFALNAVLSIGMLIIFVKYFINTWNINVCVQLLALIVCAVIEVIVRLYLAPPMLQLMHEKYKIEGAIGSGQEVGSIMQGDLVQCPHYQRIHKAFRRIHMIIAMGNMTVLLATCLHLYYLASKIQIN